MKPKVLIADPRHYTVGAHSNYIPIGIGYIASNVKKIFDHIDLELELETDAEKIFDLIDNWKPNIVAVSNYTWNSSLSNFICEYAKKQNQNILCVLGGPEFPAGTGQRKIENNNEDKTYDKCLKYLIKRPAVDYFAYTDGEIALVEVIKEFIENNLSLNLMKDKDRPIKGCANLSKNKDKLLVGEYLLRIGIDGSVKSEGRDIIPSPYTTGLLDKFLDGKFVPAFETSRGCPFACTFCDQGLDKTKITTFSVNRLAEEMWYVAKKLSHLKKGTKRISIFDSNWGIFEKDDRLADHISKVMERYDWPQSIECLTPKSNWNNLIKINDKLKNRVELSLSMQSLKSETLKDIKRTNWTIEQYIDFVKETRKRGKPNICEMIIPLPSETEETYYKGVKFLMDIHVETRTYSLMMLCGTELGRDAAIKKFDIKSKFRILPKQFGEYRGKKIFEIEKISVGTNTMNFQSYLNCRNYSFIVKLLGHSVFSPIYKLTQKLGISWYNLSRTVTNTIQDKNFKGRFKDLYNDFCSESRNELFNTLEESTGYYSVPRNYKLLLRGDIGENLHTKYTVKGILIYEDILASIFNIIRNQFVNNYNNKLNSVLNSSEKWLKNLYWLEAIFEDEKEVKAKNKYKLSIDFDFPRWLSKSNLPFEHFNNKSTYELVYDFKKIDYIKNEMTSVFGKDKKRAFARYLERIPSKFDFFEKKFVKLN